MAISELLSGDWTADAVERVQLVRWKKQLRRLSKYHPFYRALLTDLSSSDLRATRMDDLRKLPVTQKAQFVERPKDFVLQGPEDPKFRLCDVAYTSGSTSDPIPIVQTAYDVHAILFAQRRMAEIRGIGAGDVIANVFPLTTQPHGAWLRTTYGGGGVAPVLNCTPGASEWFSLSRSTLSVLDLLHHADPTIIWGVPSYVMKILNEAGRRSVGLGRLRMLALSGEPIDRVMNDRLSEVLSALGRSNCVISNSLGASELQYGLVECAPGSGFHNPAPELLYIEAVDDAGDQVSDGSVGNLAITHLDRYGTALVRYVLGDIVRISYAACPRCGRCGGRVTGHFGRTRGTVKIRGQLVDSQVVLNAVSQFREVQGFRVRVRNIGVAGRDARDELVIEVVRSRSDVDGSLKDRLGQAVKSATRITPVVEFVDAQVIDDSRSRIKIRQFLDERNEDD